MADKPKAFRRVRRNNNQVGIHVVYVDEAGNIIPDSLIGNYQIIDGGDGSMIPGVTPEDTDTANDNSNSGLGSTDTSNGSGYEFTGISSTGSADDGNGFWPDWYDQDNISKGSGDLIGDLQTAFGNVKAGIDGAKQTVMDTLFGGNDNKPAITAQPTINTPTTTTSTPTAAPVTQQQGGSNNIYNVLYGELMDMVPQSTRDNILQLSTPGNERALRETLARTVETLPREYVDSVIRPIMNGAIGEGAVNTLSFVNGGNIAKGVAHAIRDTSSKGQLTDTMLKEMANQISTGMNSKPVPDANPLGTQTQSNPLQSPVASNPLYMPTTNSSGNNPTVQSTNYSTIPTNLSSIPTDDKIKHINSTFNGDRTIQVSSEYELKLAAALSAVDPDLRVVITQGGQEHKDQVGSTRHNLGPDGKAMTADFNIYLGDKQISPVGNPELTAKIVEALAATGMTGFGIGSSILHAGGGTPAVWGYGPNGDGKKQYLSNPDLFQTALDNGIRLNQQGVGEQIVQKYIEQASTNHRREELSGATPAQKAMNADGIGIKPSNDPRLNEILKGFNPNLSTPATQVVANQPQPQTNSVSDIIKSLPSIGGGIMSGIGNAVGSILQPNDIQNRMVEGTSVPQTANRTVEDMLSSLPQADKINTSVADQKLSFNQSGIPVSTGAYPISDPERERILVQTVLGEAANQGKEGMMAVANVIKNRSLSPEFPDDPMLVALQPKQFSTHNSASLGGNNPEKYKVGSAEYNRALEIVKAVFNDELPDNTYGSKYYHTPQVSPSWANKVNDNKGTYRIGDHIFYPEQPVDTQRVPKYFDAPMDAGFIANRNNNVNNTITNDAQLGNTAKFIEPDKNTPTIGSTGTSSGFMTDAASTNAASRAYSSALDNSGKTSSDKNAASGLGSTASSSGFMTSSSTSNDWGGSNSSSSISNTAKTSTDNGFYSGSGDTSSGLSSSGSISNSSKSSSDKNSASGMGSTSTGSGNTSSGITSSGGFMDGPSAPSYSSTSSGGGMGSSGTSSSSSSSRSSSSSSSSGKNSSSGSSKLDNSSSSDKGSAKSLG